MSDNPIDKPVTTAADIAKNAVTGIGQFVQQMNERKSDSNSRTSDVPGTAKNSNPTNESSILSKAGEAAAATAAGAVMGGAAKAFGPGGIIRDGAAGAAGAIGDDSKTFPNFEKILGDKIGDKVPTQTQNGDGKQRETDKSEHLLQHIDKLGKWETFDSKKEGVTKLNTGDKIVRGGGTEVLIAPNGGTVTVNKDGSIEIDSKESVKIATKNNRTTLTYPNGDTVEVKNGAISRVSRGGNDSESDASSDGRWENVRPIGPVLPGKPYFPEKPEFPEQRPSKPDFPQKPRWDEDVPPAQQQKPEVLPPRKNDKLDNSHLLPELKLNKGN